MVLTPPKATEGNRSPFRKASIEMFDEPMDAPLWQLVALAAGTGGSMLAVGSVAGAPHGQWFSWGKRLGKGWEMADDFRVDD